MCVKCMCAHGLHSRIFKPFKPNDVCTHPQKCTTSFPLDTIKHCLR